MYTPRSSAFSKTPVQSPSSASRLLKLTARKSVSSNFTPGNSRSSLQLGRSTIQNRSLQTTQVIEETSQHIVECYGSPLPVQVTEALTQGDRGTESRDPSAKLSESGWAWLVCGRRLLVWRYKHSLPPRQQVNQCRELALPASDLVHKADLVCVTSPNDLSPPSAIAVSPEGIVRYWPNINQEGSYVESSAELHGQEGYSLTDLQSLGLLLGTTTTSLILLTPLMEDGQTIISCRNLTVPQGVLVGFSRRFTSLIFGSMSNHSTESKLINLLSQDGGDDDEKVLFVLTGNSLQKWVLAECEPDKLCCECDVIRLVKESFIEVLWGRDFSYMSNLKTWLVDMQISRNGVVVLSACYNPSTSSDIHYGLAVFVVDVVNSTFNMASFAVIKHTEPYQDNDEETSMGFKLLLPNPGSPDIYMYGPRTVHCISNSSPSDEADEVEFNTAGDKILGAGACNQQPLFFTNNHGVVLLSPAQSRNASMMFNDSATLLQASRLSETLSGTPLSSIQRAESLLNKPDKDPRAAQLRKALVSFCSNDMGETQVLINSLFPSMSASDPSLDALIVNLSQGMIDDFPASDPRWAESVPQDVMAASVSLILLHQLQDKQTAHNIFLTFLHTTALWDKLSVTTLGETSRYTQLILMEHAEKLVAALSLRKLHTKYNGLLDSAIKMVLQQRGQKPSGKLSHQDMFYRQVSQMHDIYPALIKCEELVHSDTSPQEEVNTITAVNTLILECMQDVVKYRDSKPVQVPVSEEVESHCWTSSTGLRNLLLKQADMTMKFGVPAAGDAGIRGNLYQQCMDIAELVLQMYEAEVQGLPIGGDTYNQRYKQYATHRHQLIYPFLEAEQYERAVALAEKYHDFAILVQLCDVTDNHARLNKYIQQFAHKNFGDFVFQWYIDQGKKSRLLSLPVDKEDLNRFLQGRDELSWLNDINNGAYGGAAETLKGLAAAEKDCLMRKKHFLSLSKLSTLACDTEENIQPEIDDIIKEQNLVQYQESLPEAVLDNFGLDAAYMRVMAPTELIEMYIGAENEQSNEFDFQKALELIEFTDRLKLTEAEVSALRIHVWCRALLKDSWDDIDTDSPLETKRETLFFRLIDLLFRTGLDVRECLPPVENLVDSDELGSLRTDTSFRFLVKATYEHLARMLS